MKRIAMAMVAVLLMVTMLVTASADNFVNSVAQVGKPELQGNPEVSQGIFLVLTPYAERASLPDAGATMEAAYQALKGADSLADINAELEEAAKQLGVSADDLVVSDLFDLSLIYSTGGFVLDEATLAEYMPVTITLKADLLDRFVGLLHYKDGKFVAVENAKVENGNLVFTVDSLSPFAIIVGKEGTTPGTSEPESPDTGDMMPWGIAAVMALAALTCVLFIRREEAAE